MSNSFDEASASLSDSEEEGRTLVEDEAEAARKKEKQEEQAQFATCKQLRDDTTVEKQRATKEASEIIEMSQADIEKYEANAVRKEEKRKKEQALFVAYKQACEDTTVEKQRAITEVVCDTVGYETARSDEPTNEMKDACQG